MGKNTGGNRKKGRAGAGAGAGAPGQQLTGIDANKTVQGWLSDAYPGQSPNKLFNEKGLTMSVATDGEITLWAQGDISIQSFSNDLAVYAKSKGLKVKATTREIGLPVGGFQKFKLLRG